MTVLRTNRVVAALVLLAMLAGLGGCTTWVTSEPATYAAAGGKKRERAGQRYFLPIPVLIVKPQPDGTILVEKDYLPDPQHEYVIDAGSFLSSHKLVVQTDKKGLLRKVTLNQNSAVVAEELAKQGGEVAKAALDDLKAERKAETTARDAIVADIRKTEIELEQSRVKIDFYQSKVDSTSGDEKTKWQAKLDEEQVNFNTLDKKLELLRRQRTNYDSNGFNFAGVDDMGFQKAWGPLIFRVEQTLAPAPEQIPAQGSEEAQAQGSKEMPGQSPVIDWATGKVITEAVPNVRLVALFPQAAFPTHAVATSSGEEEAFNPTLDPKEPISLSSGDLSRTLRFNKAVASVDRFALVPAAASSTTVVNNGIARFVLDRSGSFALLEINPAVVDPGAYDLLFSGRHPGGETFPETAVRLKAIP